MFEADVKRYATSEMNEMCQWVMRGRPLLVLMTAETPPEKTQIEKPGFTSGSCTTLIPASVVLASHTAQDLNLCKIAVSVGALAQHTENTAHFVKQEPGHSF